MKTEYNIGECPICGQGLLIVARDVDQKILLIICDDCEMQWNDPISALAGASPIDPEYRAVEDANEDDIRRKGWACFVKNIEPIE